MNNADMPATPLVMDNGHPFHVSGVAFDNHPLTSGLTKREQACISLGIPETGDEDLDALIRQSERKRIAMHAMQGLLSNSGGVIQSNNMSGFSWCNTTVNGMADLSLECADALINELSR